MSERIIIPDEGDVCYQPALIPAELAVRSSLDTNSDLSLSGVRHFLTHTNGQISEMLDDIVPYGHSTAITDEIRDTAHLARTEIYSRILEMLDLDWREIVGYARIMSLAGGPKGGLDIHTDHAQDIRVLINAGGTGQWLFAGVHRARYPNGLLLNPGDAATINNYCIPDEQVQHGARLAPNVPIRTSFLFHIHEAVGSHNN